jgi:3-oxoacyl-[acyl-carrier protein] reductase
VGAVDRVQVNAINPGAVRTARLAARLQRLSKEKGISEAEAEILMVAESSMTRIGEPEDVANLVAFMVLPGNRYFHGALVDLDGGATKTI